MDIESHLIEEAEGFPNNPKLPLLHYHSVLEDSEPSAIQNKFESNGWKNSWVDGVFSYHHFHSNTHEALGVASGFCDVQIGGGSGAVFRIEKGDVLVIPAGVSHKNVGASDDFVCVGSYPTDIPYDMKREGAEGVKERIQEVGLPEADPAFGEEGPLFDYWSD